MHKLSVFVVAVGVAFLSGCGGKRPVAGPVAEKAPEWVQKGSGAFKEGGNAAIYGVGVSQIKNRSLQYTYADEAGRAEIAKILNSYVTSLTKSYMASTQAGDPSKSSEEQHVSATFKNFARATLHGATAVDRWKDPTDGTLFSLVKLDMAAVKKTLAESKELDSKVRDFVRANADKAFDDLAAEEARR